MTVPAARRPVARACPAWLPGARLAIVICCTAAVAASFAPFTWPMRVAVGGACLALAQHAWSRGWFRRAVLPARARDALPASSVVVWAVLVGALAAFQLVMYFSAPRSAHPTVSSLASGAFDAAPATRALAFGAWLWFGWYVVRR